MLEQGMILGDRYEIIEKIGAGGMSVVYKAKCTKLNRFVAIKVLREEFVDDENFVSKFKIEAQAAASLTHPNIVNVYDVGNQGEIYYIVMECVEGINLKDYIRNRGRLTSEETLKIAIKICEALKIAHENNIIHRDIKPQNILIADNGDVKVADFGIARAVSSTTITTNAIGSVHYFSPEQARGGYVDEKSDLYSLGITMYELVTNSLPFQADSPVSVAIQHLKTEFPQPSTIVADIWPSLEKIIIKATQKKPESRYKTADAFIKDMKQALLHKEMDIIVNGIEDVEAPTINMSKEVMQLIREQDEMDDSKIVPKRDHKEKVVMASAIMTAFVIVGCLLFLGIWTVKYFMNKSTEDIVKVPGVTGISYDLARNTIRDTDLIIEKKQEVFNDEVPAGKIISQIPVEGTLLERGDVVSVSVSKGQKLDTVPDLKNKLYDEAEQILTEKNFAYELVTQYDNHIEAGVVMEQSPEPGEKVIPHSTIKLVVSKGPKGNYYTVPSILGISESQAKARLRNAGLRPGNVSTVENDTVEKGLVVAQNVNAGETVKENYEVDFVISSGKKVVPETTEDGSDTGSTQNGNTGNANGENGQEGTGQENNVEKRLTILDLLDPDEESGTLVIVQVTSRERFTIYNDTVKHNSFPIYIPLKDVGESSKVELYLNGQLEYEIDKSQN